MRRYANKKDGNQAGVLTILGRLGVGWADIDTCTGIDLLCYDGLVGFFTMEVKARGGKLTERQLRWAQRMKAFDCPHLVHWEGEDLVEQIAALRKQYGR